METEQKHQQDKVLGRPNNKAAPASGDACRTGNQDPASSVPTVSSDVSPSGSASLSSSRAGSTAAAIFTAHENPGLPIMAAVPSERYSDLQACCSLREDLGCEVTEGGSQAAVGPPPKATGHAEHPAGTKSPWNNRRRKQPCRDRGAYGQKPPGRCLLTRLLPPSSPGSQPSSRRCSQASTSSQATQPGPALLSHASETRPASQSLIALPASARHGHASGPGPVFQHCTAPPGLSFPPFAVHLDPARLSPESAPDPTGGGHASAPEPTRGGRASAPEPTRGGRPSAPDPTRGGRASAPDPTPGGRASAPEPTRGGRPSAPDPTRGGRASAPDPTRGGRASAPGPTRRGRASAPGPAGRGRASAPGPAGRGRAPAPGPAGRGRAPAPGPARRGRAPAPGPAPRGRAPAPGPAPRGSASATGAAPRGRASTPGSDHRSRSRAFRGVASRSGPALRGRTSGSSPPLQRSGHPPGRALRSTARSTPARRSTSMTPDTGLRSCSTQRRSALLSRSLSGPADENPSCGAGLRRLAFQSSSGSPDPEVPSSPSPPVWHAVRMRASSPSPPRSYFLPIPQQWDESSSSSSPSPSRSPGTSPSSSPTKISGQSSSSSSPEFLGLRSISTPSPESLRRALMPELYAPSPVPPEEQAEIESTAHPPPPPEL
ncbi:EZH inhibitory protein [Callithrix jacchus]